MRKAAFGRRKTMCYSKWIKLTVETYLVIDSILTSGLDIVETEDF